MSDAPTDTCARSLRYSTIACEILIFGFIGWLVGPYIFGSDLLGALVGALFGTLMMFLTLCYMAGVFKREPAQPQENQETTQQEAQMEE